MTPEQKNKLVEEAREKIKRMLLRDAGIMDEEMDAIIKSAIAKAIDKIRKERDDALAVRDTYGLMIDERDKELSRADNLLHEATKMLEDLRNTNVNLLRSLNAAQGEIIEMKDAWPLLHEATKMLANYKSYDLKQRQDFYARVNLAESGKSRAAHASEQGQEKWTKKPWPHGGDSWDVYCGEKRIVADLTELECDQIIDAHNAALQPRDSAEDTKRLDIMEELWSEKSLSALDYGHLKHDTLRQTIDDYAAMKSEGKQ